MENNMFLKKYTLSDLFDGTFKMLKFTWKNTLIICGICFIPLGFAQVFFMSSYFKVFAEMFNSGLYIHPDKILDVLRHFSGFIGFAFLYGIVSGLVTLFVKAVIVLNKFRAARGESIDLKDLVLMVLKQKLGKLFLQSILYVLIIIGVTIVAIIAMTIVIGVLSMLLKNLAIFIGVLAYIAFICLLVWLVICFSFIQEEVIYADTPVTTSFKKSFKLVKGNWWRVFGILLVFSIALSFFVSIVTSPITFSIMAPFYSKIFESILDGGTVDDLYTSLFTLYSKALIPLYFSSLLSMVFTYFLSPIFTSLFYLDLTFRKKETEHEPYEAMGDVTGTDIEGNPEIEIDDE